MSRYLRNFLYFFIPFTLAIASGLTFAAATDATRIKLPGYLQTVGGFYANPEAFQGGPQNPTFIGSKAYLEYEGSYGTKNLPVPVSLTPELPRLASSVGTFLGKAVPYVGAAVALYDLTCSLTNICHDATMPSGLSSVSPASPGWTVDSNHVQHAPAITNAIDNNPITGRHRCQDLYDSTVSANYNSWQPDNTVSLPVCRVSYFGNGYPQYQGGGPEWNRAEAPTGYTWQGGSSTLADKTGTVPLDGTVVAPHNATQSEILALSVNTALNTYNIASKLAATGEPVPVEPPIATGVTVPIFSSDVVNKDAAGNPISTTTTTTSMEIIPAPLTGDPLRVLTGETKTIITKDGSGNITSSSTTTTSSYQNPPSITSIASSTPTIKLPDDYNREITQKTVETTLKHMDNSDGSTLPTVDATANAASISAETQKSVDLITGINATDSALEAMFHTFVWTPPAIPCTNPILNYKGFSTTPDICTPASYLNQALTFFFALFGAWEVYSILFRR